MSSICRGGFVENAWRKDLCSNCFRTREEHEGMTSGFYSQPSWTHQASPSPVAIQVNSPPPPLTGPNSALTYGLPLTSTQSKVLSASSKYQPPGVGSGLITVGNTGPPQQRSTYGHGGGPAAIGSRINALYSDRVTPSSIRTTSGGVNVTVNGTTNSGIKKHVQQYPAPPQPAVRTSITSGGSNRVHTNSLQGGGVSVSVGRSSSYSSQLNTVGTVASVRSNNVGVYNNSSNTYRNSVSNNGTTSHLHYHQQRRTAHSQPPTHHQLGFSQANSNSQKSSSVPVLSQSRTHHIHQKHNTVSQHVKPIQAVSTTLITASDKERSKSMDLVDAEVKTGQRFGGFEHTASSPTLQSNKGILKREGQKRKMSVSFPHEVSAVIGYGGECSSEDELDEEVPFDPMDSSSIPEIMDRSATSPLEKEINRVTAKNTNFNSVKTNLLGFAPIEIGPIVGGTGGKAKPIVSIGTFDARKEPLRVLRKVTADDPLPVAPASVTKTVKPLNRMVTSFGKVKASSSPPTEKPKASVNSEPRRSVTQMNGSDNRVPVQKGKGNETLVAISMQTKSNHSVLVNKYQKEVCISSAPSPPVLQASNGIEIVDKPPSLPSIHPPFSDNDVEHFNSDDPVSLTEIIPEISMNDRLSYVSLPHDSLEPPRIINSELKLESTFLKNLPYEDDSLEADSGLDTNPGGPTITSETSESDTEKSGSNSDSGNEHDFKTVQKLKSHVGLFVSIDPDSDEVNAPLSSKKSAKLSPDSVISSEMSSTSPVDSSGSNESIPQQIEEETKAEIITVAPAAPASKLTNTPIPPMLKRTAPPPPVVPPPRLYSSEDLYDDVHLSGSQIQRQDSDYAEESIYDDCATIGNEERKGSYDFTDQSGGIAPDFGGEGVPLKQYPGIEFLGIRRIDSESFLKEGTPPSLEIPTPKSSPGKKQRSGSESPKPKRRMNQFFSTIGKKAGAAFRSTNQGHAALDLSTSIKSSSVKVEPTNSFAPYKRSMSTDEVSMTRTQELYATLTPTTLKARGLTPVLNKLSKFDLRELKEDSAEKRKPTKFATSLKKFLGFGAGKVEIEMEPGTRTSPQRVTESPPKSEPNGPATATVRPPPPPPRVHSLDTLTKSAAVSMKPARPPPPKVNQVAPSFISVFAGLEDPQVLEEQQAHDMYSPPNKPRRKASICRTNENGDNGAFTANYLETTYNHITSLNFETLQLIASQPPAKIKRASNQLLKMNKNPLRWSQFYITDVETLAYGQGYAFFSAFWEDEPCILLLQESLSCGLAPLEFDCIEMSASFEDVVQPQFVPWESSDFVNTGNGIRVYISVLAACTVQKLSDYILNGLVSPSRKFYALLQAMDFWGKEDLSNLVVFHKIPTSAETVEEPNTVNKSKSSPSPNFGLVYVVSTRIKTGSNSLLAYYPTRDVFQRQIQELMFQAIAPLLVENDKEILQRRLAGSTTEEVEAQLRLFLQLKLFGPRSGDLDKILRYRSDRQVTQWMDKERAFCMNDALKRSLERNSEPMSPLRKSFVEFLMISDNCGKTILDFIVDLYPDV